MKQIPALVTALLLASLGTGQAQKWKLLNPSPDGPASAYAYTDGTQKAYAEWGGYRGQLGTQFFLVNTIHRTRSGIQGNCRVYTYLGKMNNAYVLKTDLYALALNKVDPSLSSFMPAMNYTFTREEAAQTSMLCKQGKPMESNTIYIPADSPYFEVAAPGDGLAFEIKLDLFNNIIIKLL
ncbi:hypothetical protein [Deinococcus cellulosilyticus]|uniref:Uncharacterized protein n=1 Tax=Deinococcus cellulosilyticus (strain DSM 18568 / NBRC 106333 / KACC 11606 / 5516J-15) TaxID=1223518 RepID=A0A511NB05_DEIC1|nr:hypothetical protein [Deinococcus cellulosilyticus]GEM50009.1 hypothetical protein DC3_56440 [Deinococcus cellulosilyticus NBRC 106333 = KACC 11606]